jgi:hypothetical protein
MADWLTFLETYAPFLLHDLPWPDDVNGKQARRRHEELWGCLRPALLFFLRQFKGQHTNAEIFEHQVLFHKFAAAAQKVLLIVKTISSSR